MSKHTNTQTKMHTYGGAAVSVSTLQAQAIAAATVSSDCASSAACHFSLLVQQKHILPRLPSKLLCVQLTHSGGTGQAALSSACGRLRSQLPVSAPRSDSPFRLMLAQCSAKSSGNMVYGDYVRQCCVQVWVVCGFASTPPDCQHGEINLWPALQQYQWFRSRATARTLPRCCHQHNGVTDLPLHRLRQRNDCRTRHHCL